MIKIYRFNKKWRFEITNEVLEFVNRDEMNIALKNILKLKEDQEPK